MTWDFFQRYDDSWIWRCVNRYDITESSRNFAGLEECVADATRHGYVPRDARARAQRGSPTLPKRRHRTSDTN